MEMNGPLQLVVCLSGVRMECNYFASKRDLNFSSSYVVMIVLFHPMYWA